MEFILLKHVFSLTDICLYVPLAWCDFAAHYDFSPYPKLNALFNNIKALPYHDEVNQPAFDFVKEKIKDKLPNLKRSETTGF